MPVALPNIKWIALTFLALHPSRQTSTLEIDHGRRIKREEVDQGEVASLE
jgi:hypothetical protein